MTRAPALVVLVAAACGRGDPPPPPVDGTPAREALASQLAKLALGAPPPLALRGQVPLFDTYIDTYIDALLARDELADHVAGAIVLGPIVSTIDEAAAQLIKLRTFDAGGRRIHYLVDRCNPDDAVSVRPWWNAGTIAICPRAYAPTHRIDPHTGYRCGSRNQVDQLRNLVARQTAERTAVSEDATYCGCGPALVFCVPDDDTRTAMARALEAEVTGTVAQLVREDRPLEEAFTRNETYRDSAADFFYQRSRLLAGEIDTLPSVEHDTPAWRPRPESWPGQHAGILTTYHMLYLSDGIRDRMRDLFSILWCSDRGSHGATAEAIYGLGVTDLRNGGGWQQLAAMPSCTDCHARLDYGMQFFRGFASSYDSLFAGRELVAPGTGPLYGNDVSDLRGHADLTPAGFARLAVAQPELATCAVQRVSRHVLGDAATTDDVAALAAVFAQTHRVRAVMREALRRFAMRWTAVRSQGGGSVPEPAAAAPGSAIAVSRELRRVIDRSCLDCHDRGDRVDLRSAQLPRGLVVEMLGRVAWGDMPRPPHVLSHDDRDWVVRALIHQLWPAGPDRTSAESYFLGRGLPIHAWGTLRAILAGAPPALALERYVDPPSIQYSPGFVSAIASSAATLCRELHGAALDRCVHEHLVPAPYVTEPLP